jgi:hypothetical protein
MIDELIISGIAFLLLVIIAGLLRMLHQLAKIDRAMHDDIIDHYSEPKQ